MAAGVLTRRQLRERGYRRLCQGVYADPGLPFDHRLRCRGVALLLPSGAAIGGLSAAAWHGAPLADTFAPVTVVRPPDVEWKGPREARVHRTPLGADDIEIVDDVPITSALRTAWDVATLESLGSSVAVLDAMVRAGSIALDRLSALADDRTGRWGVSKVRRALPLVDPRAESPPESRVRVALVLAGLAPVPQYEVREAGQHLGRVDLAFPDARIAVEYEGAYHFEDDQIVRDDARYARLRQAGWTVMRVSAADLRDLNAVVARVRAALLAAKMAILAEV
jgi:hypothetical protein